MVDEDALNIQIRKFLKVVGVTSQREIEKAVHSLEADGRLPVGKPVKAVVTLNISELGLDHKIEGEITL